MQAVAYRENIVPIRAKSIFLLQKLELRKSDSNHFKKVFAKWKFADFRRFAADRLYSRQRFRFSLEGLRLQVYRFRFTASGLPLQVYGQKATRHLRIPSYGQIGVLQPYDLPVTKGVG